MRRFLLFTLLGVLAAIILARSLLPEPAVPVFSADGSAERNELGLVFPGGEETAGSGMAGELSAYFQGLVPTEKHAYTGALRGKSLLFICADEWTPDPDDALRDPALRTLARQSVPLGEVWRPEWYQGAEGRLFARLAGLTPTRVGDGSSLAYAASAGVYLPFSLPNAFRRAGGESRAFLPEGTPEDTLAALGFDAVETGGDAAEMASRMLEALDGAGAPQLLFAVWPGDGEAALALVMDALGGTERRADTALCLLTADPRTDRAQLYLWGAGLTGASAALPCSELDLVPTLLDLFGLPYDARLLSGRDILAPAAAGEVPVTVLRGSAFSDWVTDAGRYDAAADVFTPREEPPRGADEAAYVRAVSLRVYERYVFARRAVECDYFRLVEGIE